MTQGLVWRKGHAPNMWWLREEGSLLALTNYYDVSRDDDDRKFYITGGAAHPKQYGKIKIGPFSTVEEAQTVAEMMHIMRVWQ